MFRSKPNDPFTLCRRHPKHKQSAGVCSLCLSEKLSKLAAAGYVPAATCARRRRGVDISSSISSLSSSDISSCESSRASPAARSGYGRGNFRRLLSEKTKTKGKEKGKFWSRLLTGPRRRTRMNEYEVGVISRSQPLMMTTARAQ